MENTKEWIELIDTAIKIGFGAIISGMFTYIGIKLAHRHNKEKMLFENKITKLDEITKNTHRFFRVVNKFIAYLNGQVKTLDHNIDEITFNDTQKTEMNKRDQKVTDALEEFEVALIQLRILGAEEAVGQLLNCKELLLEIRNPIMFEYKIPNYNNVHPKHLQMYEKQKEFHNELANFYNKKLI